MSACKRKRSTTELHGGRHGVARSFNIRNLPRSCTELHGVARSFSAKLHIGAQISMILLDKINFNYKEIKKSLLYLHGILIPRPKLRVTPLTSVKLRGKFFFGYHYE